MTEKRSRGRRILRWTLGALGALLVALVVGIVIYSQVGVGLVGGRRAIAPRRRRMPRCTPS